MSQGLRITFLVHAIVTLVFGIVMFLVPGQFVRIVDWTPFDPGMTQLVGAAMLSLCVSSWLGYKAANFGEVKIVVMQEIAFTAFGAIVALYQVLLADGPAFNWISAAIFIVFFILWVYFYRKHVP